MGKHCNKKNSLIKLYSFDAKPPGNRCTTAKQYTSTHVSHPKQKIKYLHEQHDWIAAKSISARAKTAASFARCKQK